MSRAVVFILAASFLLAACRGKGAPAPSPTPLPLAAAPGTTPSPVPPREVPVIFQFLRSSWRTDFTRYSVDPDELLSGGPPKDGIPAIDSPKFISVAEADKWLNPLEPVLSVEIAGDARAYPLQITLWHEIVNDTVGGVPIAVTFCPLCNTPIVFDRRLEGKVYDFGVSGLLRFSDLVMYDRQTESWWQQVTGEAIVGELTGGRLAMLPAATVSWQEFKKALPRGKVLSRETGFSRPYGENPYVGYDRIDQPPFLFIGKLDERLPPMERVVALTLDGASVAFPFTFLSKAKVIHHRIRERQLVVFYQGETLSPLDQPEIHASKLVGAVAVYEAVLEGKRLTFEAADEGFRDRETGSTWNLLGQAVSGSLKGERLAPVVHFNSFWFAWAAFQPNTQVWRP